MELCVESRIMKKHQYPLIPDEGPGTSRGPKMSQTAMQRDRQIRETASRFLNVLSHSEEALALFDLIYPQLEKKQISPQTLEITLAKKGNAASLVKVSLIQYLAVLTDAKREVEASSDIIKFHQYLKNVVGLRLPSVFVLNKSLAA